MIAINVRIFIINILLAVLLLSHIPVAARGAVIPIDISICKDADYEATYASCVNQVAPMKEAADKVKEESEMLSKTFFAPDSDYNTCLNQVCAKGTSNPLHDGDVIKTEADREECVNQLCEPLLQEYNRKLKDLNIEYNNKKSDYEAALCTNCVSPFCTYKHHQDCLALGSLCEEYAGGPIIYLGCGGQDDQPLIKPEDVDIPSENDQPIKEPSPEVKAQVNSNKHSATNNIGGGSGNGNEPGTEQKNAEKIASIGKRSGTTTYEVKTDKGKKTIILINSAYLTPDNSKATLVDKKNYYVSAKVKNELGGVLEKIPLLKHYKDYVIKFVDDQKSEDQKTTDTQVQLGVGKNAAVQFNKMDGTGDNELALSPSKSLIPSTPATKPFEFVFSQLGTAVKKTMAHGFNSEYNSALEQARTLRKSGLSWSDTIRQTTKLVAEETDGKRWVQTLNAFSKEDYKSQSARIKAYIMQMKMNGELK